MILLLGFPKSGTTSFDYLFKCLGYKTYHQIYGIEFIGNLIRLSKKSNLALLSFVKDEDYSATCLTQMDICHSFTDNYWPQIVDYEQLYEENKNAVFILNKRDPYKLLNSFKNWKELDKRFIKYNNELFINMPGQNDDEKMINLFKYHYNNVNSFFGSKTECKYIEFDIEKDTINKLAKYIDIKNIKKFPHINRASK